MHDQLESVGVSVWFSEKDIPLGTPFLREIDKGLAKSKIGIVLVTPALLERLRAEAGSIADKELSALLARDQLIPVVHNTTYEALRDVSPMLASRNGLNTAENTMAKVAAKLAEIRRPPRVGATPQHPGQLANCQRGGRVILNPDVGARGTRKFVGTCVYSFGDRGGDRLIARSLLAHPGWCEGAASEALDRLARTGRGRDLSASAEPS